YLYLNVCLICANVLLISQTKSAKGFRILRSQKCFVVRSSSSDSVDEPEAPIAPLQLESPVGQFLTQIMISHPHLVPAAVEQQLELLQTDRESEKQDDSPSGTDLVLYRRIAEVKANDRKKALEEILYALVVQKFMEANVSLIPSITPSSPNTWANQNENLESLHSPEAYEMIQNHLSLILGNRLGDSTSVAQISKLRVGQVYAASIMYGYFLKRVDQRFQLEKTMKNLPQGINDEERKKNETVQIESETWGAGGPSPGGFGHGMKSSKLRNYVMSFDGETLQKYATIRSKEAVTMIEKHTEALFGKPEVVMTPLGSIDPSNHDHIKISFGGLKRLVLEAVTFGSFLWDVESQVDSRYHFVMN
ncbi:UV-B-induced protein At3g17800, chloroplastic-like, partial [Impatiens glandulifera]|uniref:UV-B-induced protein At3g17800, chloroplastic-like n=1 Tax=Impatiens glandulifera TaxID=253017 RepID=UPI001FB17737